MDVDILTNLTGIDRINAIAAHVETLPQDQRGPTTRAYQRNIPKWEAAELRFKWNLHARESQLPPRWRLGHLAHSRRARLWQDTHRSRVDSLSG